MEVDPRQLREKMEELSDEELIHMLFEDPDQYRSDALALAKEEVVKRNLSFEHTATSTKEADKPDNSRFVKSIEVGARAAVEAMGPGSYCAAGIKIICPNCQHNQFQSESVLLNTRGLTFFKLDWLNSAATTLACSNCGLIQWFKQAPERG